MIGKNEIDVKIYRDDYRGCCNLHRYFDVYKQHKAKGTNVG